MNKNITELLSEALGYFPTTDQQTLMGHIANFIGEYYSPERRDDTLVIKGYAGTGKTSVVGALVKALPKIGLKSILLAPTGRAAKVLASYSGHPAFTIHKKIYRQKSSTSGLGEFSLDKNLHQRTIFIVDEASMISNTTAENSIFGTGRLLDDLFEYVYKGEMCKLILVGDTAQLPPVGLAISPALDIDVIKEMGFNATEFELKQVVRQSKESGILANATMLRKTLKDDFTGYPHLSADFPDIRKISGGELIEEIENCYDKYGIENTMVLCRSNKRANKYNEGIRRSILWREEEIAKGDLLMIVKNNYFWLNEEEQEQTPFIANGDIAEITHIGKYHELYGFRFVDVGLKILDYANLEIETKIMLDTLSSESPALTWEENQQLFNAVIEDYADIRNKRDRIKKVKENHYFNALQVKFSYAITCHKAQGGQWKAVFIDQGWLADDMLNAEFVRWLYTAFTRPTEKLYLVNFKDEFFA